jgi:hypothetical protein
MSEKRRFQEVLQDLRNDMKFLEQDLFKEFVQLILRKHLVIDQQVKDWVFDVFLDKFYEMDAKVRKIAADLGYKVKLPSDDVKKYAEDIACKRFSTIYDYEGSIHRALEYLHSSITYYSNMLESRMSSIRSKLYEKGWEQVNKLKNEEYVLATQRVRYVQAREELGKAKQAVQDKHWDEVLNHLRPAIDLALREKLDLTKIQPMKQFLMDAEKYGLPLPSYTMLYDYFDEGTQRIHGGRLNTPFECQKALEFVAGFIDRLEAANIPQEEIKKFKKMSKTVQ